MPRPSPTLEGFRVLFRLPSLGLAEIAWRWALGAAFLASFAFATLQYLNSLPVSAADMLATVAVFEAAVKALETGATIQLEEVASPS